jgi:hypothetical protein
MVALLLLTLPSLIYPLEEKQFQAKVFIKDTKDPEAIFPLTLPSYATIKNLFSLKGNSADYKKYNEQQKAGYDSKDLCGVHEPVHINLEGDLL